jgi:hypothetical protein
MVLLEIPIRFVCGVEVGDGVVPACYVELTLGGPFWGLDAFATSALIAHRSIITARASRLY